MGITITDYGLTKAVMYAIMMQLLINGLIQFVRKISAIFYIEKEAS